MIAVPFDVNDSKLRELFFNEYSCECIACLEENTLPAWGKMSPQNMIEHLVWAFECSVGAIEVQCQTPQPLLERAKRFLHDNRPTPHDFKNPLIGENPPPIRFKSFIDAKSALTKEIGRFTDHFSSQPGAMHVHPVFGPLGGEEWQRSHFKHCYHHFQQFGLIK